jgi:hypothetical protein
MINGRRPELVVLNVQDAMTVAAGHWIVRKFGDQHNMQGPAGRGR